MMQAFTALFGDYAPVVLADGSIVTDWGYVCCVALFALVLYCVLRMVGAVFSR